MNFQPNLFFINFVHLHSLKSNQITRAKEKEIGFEEKGMENIGENYHKVSEK